MVNISNIKDRQIKKLKDKSEAEQSLAAARRAMEEIRKKRHLKEPDRLASGKSDKDGRMIIDDLFSPNEEINNDEDELKESKDD